MCVASADHFPEYLLDFLQPVDLFAYVPQLVLGQSTGLPAVGAIVKPEQVVDLVETEA
jgi:hypothetical protein